MEDEAERLREVRGVMVYVAVWEDQFDDCTDYKVVGVFLSVESAKRALDEVVGRAEERFGEWDEHGAEPGVWTERNGIDSGDGPDRSQMIIGFEVRP